MKKIGLLLIGVITLFTACNRDVVKMTVASEKRTAMGAAPMEVLLVKEGDGTEWTYFYSDIEGFNYEPGYEYVLEVKKEAQQEPVPADASAFKYTLVNEISKTQKTSENMPEDTAKKDEIVTMTVASEKRTAMGATPMEVLLVKEEGDTEWEFFYSNIEGFNHEPGYEYVLEVKKETIDEPTPADASSIKYTLTNEVSKTKKKSENMPKSTVKKN